MSVDVKKPEGPSGTTINAQIEAGQKRSKLLRSQPLKEEYKELGSVEYWNKYGSTK